VHRERTTIVHTTRRTILKGAALSPLALALSRFDAGAQDAIKVGSKDFPESIIIGEIYALLLENAGFSVERKLNLGGTVIAQEALLSGDLDLYPEYTGTGLLVVLGESLSNVPGLGGTPTAGTAVASAEAVDPSVAVYDYVNQRYQEEYGLVWLDQTPMNDSQALAVTSDFAAEHSLTTISDLVAIASDVELVISAPVDFEEREDGLKGLRATYGDFPATVNGVAPGIKYQALLDGDANVVLAFTTDAEIGFNDLVVLEDDLGLWPPYHVAPVVRQDTLEANPGIADALNAVAQLITTEIQIDLNGQVVGPAQLAPEEVARIFLEEQQLIPA
jgi:osmoprotectant transport system substrate-binding protein